MGPLHRRLEMRNAALDPDRAVEIGQARLVDGIDQQVQLDRAVRPGAARRNPIRITLPGDRERAVALGGADQGAHVAAKAQLFEGDLRAACGIRKSDMTVFDGEMVDRYRIGIETDRRRRPIEPPGLVEAEGELGPFHRHVGGTKLAAHQRIEGELDLQRAGPRPRQLARPAHLDPLQLHRGGRQDMDLDGADKPHFEAGEARGLGLEGIAVASPIDKKRTDQRRHQRQDDCNGNSEQRRLHAVPTAEFFRLRPPGPGTHAPDGPVVGLLQHKTGHLSVRTHTLRQPITWSRRIATHSALERMAAVPSSAKIAWQWADSSGSRLPVMMLLRPT